MERPKGYCGKKLQYSEVSKKRREDSSGILAELCLRMPYKVLMVCCRIPLWYLDDRARAHASKGCSVSVHDSVRESDIVNPQTALYGSESEAGERGWHQVGNCGSALEECSTGLQWRGMLPALWPWKDLAPSQCLWLSPRTAAPDVSKGRLLNHGVQVWWERGVLCTQSQFGSAILVTLGSDVLCRTRSLRPHLIPLP